MTASPRTVAVGGELPYQIHIGPGLLSDASLLGAAIRGRHVLLASDDTVAPLYLARVRDALQTTRPELKIGQYVIPAGLEPDGLLAHMRLDKKNIAGRLRLVLWRGIGKAEVVADVDEAAVLAVLRQG